MRFMWVLGRSIVSNGHSAQYGTTTTQSSFSVTTRSYKHEAVLLLGKWLDEVSAEGAVGMYNLGFAILIKRYFHYSMGSLQ